MKAGWRKLGRFDVNVDEDGVVVAITGKSITGVEPYYIYTYDRKLDGFVRQDNIKYSALKKGYEDGTYSIK